MLQKIDLYVATHVPKRAKTVCKACSTMWCISTMWFAHCYSFWTLYAWDYIVSSPLYNLEDFELLHFILIHNQICFGLIADKHPAFNIFLSCILITVLNYFSYNHLYEPVFVRDLFIHTNIAGIIPASSILYAQVFNYKQLCVMFCFLKGALTFLKSLESNENNYVNPLYEIFILCMTVTIVLLTNMPVFCENAVKKEVFPPRNAYLKILWLIQKRFVINIVLCAFLLKFLSKIIMDHIERHFPLDIVDEQFQTDITACVVCGLVATGLNFSHKEHTALKSVYRICLLCSAFLYMATYFMEYINPYGSVWVYSLYFTMMEVFLVSPLSVKVGEYYGNCEGALIGIVMATQTAGEAAAFIVLRLVPTFIHPVVAMIIMHLYTYAIFSLIDYNEKTLLPF